MKQLSKPTFIFLSENSHSTKYTAGLPEGQFEFTGRCNENTIDIRYATVIWGGDVKVTDSGSTPGDGYLNFCRRNNF